MKKIYFSITIILFLIFYFNMNRKIENYILTTKNKLTCKNIKDNDLKMYSTHDYILITPKKIKKKFIVILGEEYWFQQILDNNMKIDDSIYLINSLKKDKRYNYLILKTPKKFIHYIEKIGKNNIGYVFLFQDIISDSYLNNMKLINIINYCKKLEKNNIIFYPGIEITNLFASKRYYKILLDKMNYSVLPGSIVLKVKNFKDNEDIEYTVVKLYKICQDLIKKFNKIIIKKGYSYNEVQVVVINKELLGNITKFTRKLLELDNKKFFGKKSDAKKWETNIDRYYIIQGYNKVIKDSKNEYRVFFINGEPSYISWNDETPNQCVSDVNNVKNKYVYQIKDIYTNMKLLNSDASSLKKLEENDIEISKEIIKFSMKVFNDFLKYFWVNKPTKYPIIFRTDISWAEDNIFQDEHSVYLIKKNKKVRFYINELEIDPSHYFYNNLFCKTNKKINSKYIQEKVGKLIVNYITKLEKYRL